MLILSTLLNPLKGAFLANVGSRVGARTASVSVATRRVPPGFSKLHASFTTDSEYVVAKEKHPFLEKKGDTY